MHDAPILTAGGVYQGFAHSFNLNHVSNASALWLNMEPPDLFVYVFLPPLLLQSAMFMDLFLLRKVGTGMVAGVDVDA